MNTKRLPMLAIALAVLWLSASYTANATPLTVGDSQELGYVQYGIPSGDAERTAYVNFLISLAPGTTGYYDPTTGQTYTRTTNTFGTLPTAVFGLDSTSATTSIDLGTGMYSYLLAKYDGPNYGSLVWYVGNLSGDITIPSGAGGTSGTKYGLSGWTLFGPGGGSSVPEPGTLLLFSAGLAGLGFILSRRKKV